ncbi:hypothetical protein JHK82_056647 [Glycine max]|nr:hypothetical protein JHK85_057488 [Glycine max]KAG5077952.1 hypothetical protein JHK82_056647 [Glycine max]KAH1036510.1 hypothetical protein GYH30_056118 [Glycine max]KAH1191290.1 hypothetical protein GmHk_20G058600 [Glycine max]
MNTSALCSLMLTLCLILISYSLLLANAKANGDHCLLGNSQQMIDQICNQTSQNENECLKILKADPKIVQAKDYFEISKAILKLATKKAKEGQHFLKGLAHKTGSAAIALCANQWYPYTVGSFGSALGELKESPDTANYDAKVAGDGPVYCDEAIAKAHIVNPAISALNHKTSLLSFIAFLATNCLSEE